MPQLFRSTRFSVEVLPAVELSGTDVDFSRSTRSYELKEDFSIFLRKFRLFLEKFRCGKKFFKIKNVINDEWFSVNFDHQTNFFSFLSRDKKKSISIIRTRARKFSLFAFQSIAVRSTMRTAVNIEKCLL